MPTETIPERSAGPWTVRPGSIDDIGNFIIVNRNGRYIAAVSSEADALAMAASYDLLYACKRIVVDVTRRGLASEPGSLDWISDAIQEVVTAVEKAEKGTPDAD